jgi:hypothetical protein
MLRLTQVYELEFGKELPAKHTMQKFQEIGSMFVPYVKELIVETVLCEDTKQF